MDAETFELDYERDSEIDITNLDVELLMQSEIARKYGKYLVYIRAQEKRSHERVKTIRSELVDEVNRNPIETTNKKSPNAGDIEAYYRRDEKYKQAKEEWIELAADLESAELAQREISYGRRRSIEGLIQLHGQQWYAGPKVPKNITDMEKTRENVRQRSNTKVGAAMKRTKK